MSQNLLKWSYFCKLSTFGWLLIPFNSCNPNSTMGEIWKLKCLCKSSICIKGRHIMNGSRINFCGNGKVLKIAGRHIYHPLMTHSVTASCTGTLCVRYFLLTRFDSVRFIIGEHYHQGPWSAAKQKQLLMFLKYIHLFFPANNISNYI